MILMKKVLILREKKQRIPELDRSMTVVKQRSYMISDTSKPFHTTYGMIQPEELQKPDGSIIESDQGKEFIIFSAGFIDKYKRLKKLPQTIPLKDIGFIITETGINKESLVLDAGAGSGALAAALAHVVKKVITHEVRQDFIANVKENFAELQLTNVELREKDVYAGFDEQEADLVTLDLPEPWKALSHAANALKVGGFIVSYSPSIPQVMDFVAEVRKDERLLIIKTVEQIERLWEFEDRRVRPKSIEIGHSGFLTLVRKIHENKK